MYKKNCLMIRRLWVQMLSEAARFSVKTFRCLNDMATCLFFLIPKNKTLGESGVHKSSTTKKSKFPSDYYDVSSFHLYSAAFL